MIGSSFATLLREMLALVHELEARRGFGTDIAEWLKEFGFVEEFEAWRKARNESRNRASVGDVV